MSKKNKTDKAIQRIMQQKLGETMKQLVSDILTGNQIENVKVKVELSLPQPVYQIIKDVCDSTGADPGIVLSKMASDGLSASLNGLMTNQVKIAQEVDNEVTEVKKPVEEFKQDLDLAKQLAGIQDFAGKLKEVSKLMETLNGTGSGLNLSSEIFKNSK